jgi:hypothetical protein
MDPELAGLASVAAGEMVKLLVTDAWQRVRTAVAALWRRAQPDHAEAVEADLAQARDALVAARDDGDEQVEQMLLAEWRGRLWRLLAANPDLAAEVRLLVAGDFGHQARAAPGGRIRMDARVRGGGSVFQAGRDQTITMGMNADEQQPSA